MNQRSVAFLFAGVLLGLMVSSQLQAQLTVEPTKGEAMVPCVYSAKPEFHSMLVDTLGEMMDARVHVEATIESPTQGAVYFYGWKPAGK